MSSLPDVLVRSVEGAARALAARALSEELAYVISIGDPGERRPPGLDGHRAALCRLEFHDIEDEAWREEGMFGATPRDAADLQVLHRPHPERGSAPQPTARRLHGSL